MNKKDLVTNVKERIEGTNKEAMLAVDSVIAAIKDGVMNDGKVSLVGFGSFEAVYRGARTCKNPQNGANIEVPAKMAPRFKPSKALKEMIATLDVVSK